ncbi:serpin family protein [Brachybacterium sp. GCM10030267]|uniref:serpin family protein n=1 Tax=Brachybacterium sp. GCM10030267 TaxID=3273381 RepID=UPI00361DCD53
MATTAAPPRRARRPEWRRRSVLTAGAALPFAPVALAGCGDDGQGEVGEPDLRAELPRAEPGSPESAGESVVPFTARLWAGIDRSAVNAVCSPLSAQIALTMAGLGAAGDTRAQMEEALGGSIDELAQDSNTLATVLAAVGDQERDNAGDDAPQPPVASLVNGTWLQEGMAVEDGFLEGLATYFASGVYEADFADDAEREQARQRINDWVAEATNDLIEELVPEDALDAQTRLVLVNALHLKAAWQDTLTRSGGTFTTAEGEEKSVEMLSGTTGSWYEDELCRATALGTYGGDLALALVQPLEEVAAVLDAWAESADDTAASLSALLSGLDASDGATELTLPGFDIGWAGELSGPLQELGMSDAFDAGAADFSGITAETDLSISQVIQKAVITVDEEGMEAAAATAVVAEAVSAPAEEHELVLDSPFLVVAYETSTLAPLVVGWIGDPTQTR